MDYDIIADVHGQIGKLEALLKKLGYRRKDGAWRHPDGRMVLFLGDLVDRGPGQVEVLTVVRDMIEAGSGRSIMGNHEWNAIGFAMEDQVNGGYLRPRTANKRKEHAAFLAQVGEDSPLHNDLVAWFKTLPPFLDLGKVRLCHAWWNPEEIARVGAAMNAAGALDERFMVESFRKGSTPWRAMEAVTKGYEIALPDGSFFLDHNGAERRDIRVRWWDAGAVCYRSAALVPEQERERIPALAPAGRGEARRRARGSDLRRPLLADRDAGRAEPDDGGARLRRRQGRTSRGLPLVRRAGTEQ